MQNDITELLLAHGKGSQDAIGQLVPLVYDELRKVARAHLRRFGPNQSIDTTGLVHEAYLRLVDQTRATWRDRGHFYAVSALAMRQILVDRARRRQRLKRGGPADPLPLDDVNEPGSRRDEELLQLDLALQRLADIDERLVRVVECRYFAGLTEEETAEALDISVRTAQREWFKARAWLREQLVRGRC
ncbi:MAG TPA: ECF-type sigma factor [Vicinamibacterales bacterium]|nr:ECF-type sigma factor [Vicinamibacterales bacterium]